MNKKKLSGSFYTPKVAADFLVDYLSDRLAQFTDIKVLEPSCGDGVFVKSVVNHPVLASCVKKIVAVERNKLELKKAKIPGKSRVIKSRHADFLNFQKSTREKFHLVIGNPPYIKKNHLKDQQIRICKEIHQQAGLLNHEPKNIWTAFLVRCVSFTNDNGVLAFILPSEFLQVKFAEELRQLLQKEFARVEYLNFHELIFDAEGQNTVLVVAYRKAELPGVYFGTIDKLDDLPARKFTLNKNDVIHTVSTKEIHHNVSSDDLSYLNMLRLKLGTMNSYVVSKPGIVTAANEFFILTKPERRKYALSKFTKPIIQRGAFVNGKVVFTKSDWENLSSNNFPCYLLDLNKVVVSREGRKLLAYLRQGKNSEIDQRYKCKHRERWYKVPNVTHAAEALFFKRCHYYPKLLKNVANTLVTDSAYMVDIREGFSIDNIVFSFYNSLTLLFAELEGRYYGGGVLELTPSEFKNLPIPYLEIGKKTFNSFKRDFAVKPSITSILDQNDLRILGPTLGLNQEDIERLRSIHRKLLMTRLKVTTL